MRLASLRLAGFKSFVEPTDIHFPGELVGIVGPNGCGKSNTLDALRWVMGESSAKHLRGQSLEDVIFAGSGQRKPVDQASVELIFEHEDDAPALQGPWARFRNLSIRRVLTRDGQSRYFLNGTRCRRKDIADLFLGTGLGRGHGASSATRSYAIIEQGQINRLLDAKPEDLRATLEEAAGISRYKERRRETETSIQHTRDNLARLNDLREELLRQIEKLERQAKAAEKYRQWHNELDLLQLAQHSLQLQTLNNALAFEQSQLGQDEHLLQQSQQLVREAQRQLEALRQAETRLQSELHQAQTESYALAAQLAQLEHSEQQRQKQVAQTASELEQVAQEQATQQQHIASTEATLHQLRQAIGQAQLDCTTTATAREDLQHTVKQAEINVEETRRNLEHLQQAAQQPMQRLAIEQREQIHGEQQIRQLQERLQRLRIAELDDELRTLERQAAQFTDEHATQQQQLLALERAQMESQVALQQARSDLAQIEGQHRALQNELNLLHAEQRALTTLEQAEQQARTPALRQWLKKHELDNALVAARTTANDTWTSALDKALTQRLQACAVASLDDWREHAQHNDTHGLCLIEAMPASNDTLAQGSHTAGLLDGLRPCSSVELALQQRATLSAGQAWLTPQGDVIGRHHWQRPPALTNDQGSLQRQQRLTHLSEAMAQLNVQHDALQARLSAAQTQVKTLDQTLGEQQQQHRELTRTHHQLQIKISQMQMRIEQTRSRLHEQQRSQSHMQRELDAAQDAQRNRSLQLDQLTAQVNEHQEAIAKARDALNAAESALKPLRQQLRDAERAEQSAQAQLHTLQREIALHEQNLAQQHQQAAHIQQREQLLQARLAELNAPQATQHAQREATRQAVVQAEQQLHNARLTLDQHTQTLREAQQQLVLREQQLEQARHQLEQRRMSVQAIELRAAMPAAQLRDIDPSRIAAARASHQGQSLDTLLQRIHDTSSRIARLGAVNLAALDELSELRAQLDAMDAQCNDLNDALQSLETAMRTMDQETRSRFRATFDAVNLKLDETFRQLFGGGEARMELAEHASENGEDGSTRDRWLDHGVLLLARPPGKKISHIHLLSGGEKSLTAIALIFAIFQLNPAPFCLLDEVDAPLDEANVGRFCAMVQAMSSRVQFIFITHNKTTMELARHLIGVTMREPGVSRIVEVDLDAAVKMLDESPPT